jgi:hypothetical protein
MPCPTYPEIRLAIKPYAKLAWVLDAYRPQAIHITAEGPLGLAGRRYCLRRKKQFTSSICTRFPEYVHLRSGLPVSWLYKALHWFHAPAKRTMVATPSLMNELETKGSRVWPSGGAGLTLSCSSPEARSLCQVRAP